MTVRPGKIYTDHIIVQKSGVHGKGLYAVEDIPRNVRIIEYIGDKVTKTESDRRADRQIQKSKNNKSGAVYIFTLNSKYDIDGNVPENTARFINHSCSPNCEVVIISNRHWVVSKRKIKKDEELTYDYGFDFDNFSAHPCRCGSENCAGFIVASKYRTKLKKILSEKNK